MNPYQAPISTDDEFARSDPDESTVSLTWFAATVAASSFAAGLVFWLYRVVQRNSTLNFNNVIDVLIGDFVFLVINAIYGGGTLSLAHSLKEALTVSVVGCVSATIYHGIADVCIGRSKSRTMYSRFAAAASFLAVYIALVWPIGYYVRKAYGPTNSVHLELPLYFFVIPATVAMISTTVDRLLGSRSAPCSVPKKESSRHAPS